MNNPHRSYDALIRCRDAAGSDSQLGRDLGITQSTIWRIINEYKRLPAEYVLLAERLYGVSRHDLRIDIYPVDLDVAAPMDCNSPQSSEPNGSAHRLSEGVE